MILIGLGNPGKKYEYTRHNIGFHIIDEFAGKNDFPDFRLSKKINALISEGIFNGKRVILAKPQTFMNNSGRAVKSLTKTSPLGQKDLIIIHDDIDLAFGKIRISQSRGSAGHRGVESIIGELGAKDFGRLRFGIQPQIGKPKNVENFVLKKFTKEEVKNMRSVIKNAIEAIETALRKGLEGAMQEYNR